MAVISLKDIIKYLIKITLIITVVVGLIQYFSNAKKNTNLPDNPDYKKINEFVASVNERVVKGEI